MDAIAGDSYDALDEVEVLAVGLKRGLEEDDDVAAVDVAIMDEFCPAGGRRERDTVNETWSPMRRVFSIDEDGMAKF